LQSPSANGERLPRAALSIASRISSLSLFPRDKKMSHSVEWTGTSSLFPSEKRVSYSVGGADSSQAASIDRLPQYNVSLSSKDWNSSENTLVAVVRDQKEKPHQHRYQVPDRFNNQTPDPIVTPPTRPPRTKSTRIPHSLQTMLSSSTSRYASVIHFFQDSNSPTPSPTPLPQAQAQLQSSSSSNNNNINGWTVTRMAPPRRPSTPVLLPPGWI
jgi:hypothetical protein